MAGTSITIDVSTVSTQRELHALLAHSLAFPAHYGHNWDAFWDCATDLAYSEPVSLTIVGLAQLKLRLPEDTAIFENCLNDLQRDHATFRMRMD
ncbi:barstar family protein [Tahibacter caeni]|uniref:barstar family protein n=1 Tax=Tahibacter caeni TaxID=1453545 RepID=UPI00214843C3|nr:barstar family protein [Tahibacter caeni]